jgi:hypothetical protein
MTRNGKIAKLPKEVRERLNRRIESGEEGKELVKWLNSLPETQALLTSDFEGRAINAQNLCEWKKRGYRDWQMKQERTEVVRQMEEEAEDMGRTANPERVSCHFSMVLMSELAQALRDAKEQVSDPKEWVDVLGRLVGRFAQLQREESNSTRAGISKEKWDRRVDRQEHKKWMDTLSMPRRAYELQKMYIEAFPEEEDGTFEDTDGEPVGGLFSVGVRVRARPEPRWQRGVDSPKSKAHPPSSDYGATSGPKSELAESRGSIQGESKSIKVNQSGRRDAGAPRETLSGTGTVPEPAGGDPSSPSYDATGACATSESRPIKVDQSAGSSPKPKVHPPSSDYGATSGPKSVEQAQGSKLDSEGRAAEKTKGTEGTKETGIIESNPITPNQGAEGRLDEAEQHGDPP